MLNSFETPSGLRDLVVHGSLELVQKENFALGYVERQVGFSEEDELYYRLQRQNIIDLIKENNSKNTSLQLRVDHQFVTPSSLESAAEAQEHIELRVLMAVPASQSVKYTPSFFEQFINLWVQYVAVLIPFAYIIYEVILGSAFRKKIL